MRFATACTFRIFVRTKVTGDEMRPATCCARLCAVLLAATSLATAASEPRRLEGRHDSGAQWAIDLPAKWNGTLLLYARGYAPAVPTRPPETGPRELRDWLLSQGYALAASSYRSGGWSLEEAPVDQMAVLDEFTSRVGAPRRTIAWGSSMGGLVSLALAERHAGRIHGALPLCGSVSGSLGMLNAALDGAFAFQALVAPQAGIRVVDIDDDRANSARVAAALDAAWKTPEGRARTVLAAVLAQLPTWSDAKAPQPAPRDYEAQAEELRKTFTMGVFVPRTDQERRAGGIYAWNTGIDYRELLRNSGQQQLVEHFYRAASLDLRKDLATLNAAPRISATPSAVDYLRRNFVPSGRWQIPVLTLQTIGDGLTIPATHGGLAQLTREAGAARQLAQLWVEGAGHCTFTAAELAAALATLEQRLDTGRWSVQPEQVTPRAAEVPGERRFIRYQPPPLLRSCGARPGSCTGEPAPADTPTGASAR